MSNGDELHVVFGTGPLGRSVVRELFSLGKRVRAMNRGGKAGFPASVEVVAADAYDAGQALQASRGATVMYQCAMPPYSNGQRTSRLFRATLSARLLPRMQN